MLFSKPTPKGTGIEIWGDYNDLRVLREIILRTSPSSSQENNPAVFERNDRLMSIIPYEIRHAYQGNRYSDNCIINGEGETTYYGFRINWITLLYSIAVLRHNAAHQPTDELTQGLIYILEHLTRKSMYIYDEVGAKQLEPFIGSLIYVDSNYTDLLHRYLATKFFSQKPGKKRFRSIPSMLLDVHVTSPTYHQLIQSLKEEAEKLNCATTDLDFDDDNNIIW